MNPLNRLFSDQPVKIVANIIAYLFLIGAVLHSRSTESCALDFTLCLIGVLTVIMISRGIAVMVKPNRSIDSALPSVKKETSSHAGVYSIIKAIAYLTLLAVILSAKISESWILYLLIALFIVALLICIFIKSEKNKVH